MFLVYKEKYMEKNEHSIIDEQIEQSLTVEQLEPVVKRGRGRPRVRNISRSGPTEPKKRGRPSIDKDPHKIFKKRGRTPIVRREEAQVRKTKDYPKVIQLDASDILKVLKLVVKHTILAHRKDSANIEQIMTS